MDVSCDGLRGRDGSTLTPHGEKIESACAGGISRRVDRAVQRTAGVPPNARCSHHV
ncbi:hypothetical protein C7S15_8911 (plasmid) [Burkholderia cepacia]|nr:hypothetical protein [Burkholderia cepacia]